MSGAHGGAVVAVPAGANAVSDAVPALVSAAAALAAAPTAPVADTAFGGGAAQDEYAGDDANAAAGIRAGVRAGIDEGWGGGAASGGTAGSGAGASAAGAAAAVAAAPPSETKLEVNAAAAFAFGVQGGLHGPARRDSQFGLLSSLAAAAMFLEGGSSAVELPITPASKPKKRHPGGAKPAGKVTLKKKVQRSTLRKPLASQEAMKRKRRTGSRGARGGTAKMHVCTYNLPDGTPCSYTTKHRSHITQHVALCFRFPHLKRRR